jgi:hypothetical protein
MYLVIAAILIVWITIRFVLRLLGFKLRPWLPQTGSRRYFADTAITALLLLCVTALVGIQPSFGVAAGLAVLAGTIAAVLESRRKRKIRAGR